MAQSNQNPHILANNLLLNKLKGSLSSKKLHKRIRQNQPKTNKNANKGQNQGPRGLLGLQLSPNQHKTHRRVQTNHNKVKPKKPARLEPKAQKVLMVDRSRREEARPPIKSKTKHQKDQAGDAEVVDEGGVCSEGLMGREQGEARH